MQKIAMIVDDSRVARMTLKKLLLASDFEVIEFSSGEEALRYLQSAPRYPQIIFMDVVMEGMDGLMTTREIKANPDLKHIPVVMCTGNDTSADQNKALEAGAVTALTKPPVASELVAILDTIQAAPETIPESKETELHVQSPFDKAEFEKQILRKIKQSILPEMQKYLEDTAEDICQKQVEEQLRFQLKVVEYHLIEQLKQQVEAKVDEAAKQACQVVAEDAVSESAYNAVKTIVEEADIPTQISDFLSHKGEEWLTRQEEDLGQQLEQLIPQKVSECLETSVQDIVSKQLQNMKPVTDTPAKPLNNFNEDQIRQLINQTLNEQATTVFQPLIVATVNKQLAENKDEETQEKLAHIQDKLSTLKVMTIGLGLIFIILLFLVLV